MSKRLNKPWYIYTTKYDFADNCLNATTLMHLKEIMLSVKKPISTVYILYGFHLYNILQNDKIMENRLVFARN